MSDLPAVYTSREAAEKLRTTEETLCRYRSRGLGPEYIRLGGKILYSAEALAAFLRSGGNVIER